uniref:Uncharacterized protein n=1 Tax=Cruciviridae sp. TaxID=1955495 RepID=A0A1S6LVQ1_9VIRU|nr:hypothetical protein [Cruciviridae sp.]AQU11798.1 hypothetical protein [Cruciviridae sp.]
MTKSDSDDEDIVKARGYHFPKSEAFVPVLLRARARDQIV